MAAIEVTISGALYDKTSRTVRPVLIIGEASYTGLGVGGGPIYPPPGGGPEPPYYPPHPSHPIVNYPAHPIVNPPEKPPVDPPVDPPTRPDDPAWSWCWNPNTGWIPAYVAGDKPQPPH